MSAVCIIIALILSDITLYVRHWKTFARRYYFVDYGIGIGWMMANRLRSK